MYYKTKKFEIFDQLGLYKLVFRLDLIVFGQPNSTKFCWKSASHIYNHFNGIFKADIENYLSQLDDKNFAAQYRTIFKEYYSERYSSEISQFNPTPILERKLDLLD